ncbi:hypothetical protein AZE42_13105 [Rhizopogon vesiculosus]|uniref:Uncharacterized protein n=1 Tax=Rhizopogon vesiculosus TaxID=180088 RepID=A0A1J8Q424_9AGAM|nr:hypothetical protein AZE42_13105 [Rhizopogon vesiculosus]
MHSPLNLVWFLLSVIYPAVKNPTNQWLYATY